MSEPVSNRTYKNVTLYNAETKKNRSVRVKRSDFADDAELEAYCDALKRDNKAKNKEHKAQKIRARINAVVGTEGPIDSGQIAHANPVVAPVEIVSFPTSPTIDINLDTNTGNTVVIYGSSKRGKTTLMMHLYERHYAHDKRYISTLYSGNPQLKIYKGDRNLLTSYGFTSRSANYIKLQQLINVKTKNRYLWLNMFDDIIDAKQAPILGKLVLTYRNSNISSIICLQYVYMLSKANRSSVNHTCVFGSNTAEDEENIIKLLLKPYLVAIGLKKLQEQVAFYREATRDHGFIYLDNIHNRMTLHRLKV